MRTSIWNQGEYAGFSDHPELQLKWFIDHALAVRQERIAQGDTTYGQDRSKWGDWVADVEQPAAEYRGRYQTHLDEADSLLSSGGGGGGAGAVDAAAAMQSAYAAGGSAVGVQALQIAERYMGTPYKWGFHVNGHGAGSGLRIKFLQHLKAVRGILVDDGQGSRAPGRGESISRLRIKAGAVGACSGAKRGDHLASVRIHDDHFLVVAGGKQAAILSVHRQTRGARAGREGPVMGHLHRFPIDFRYFVLVGEIDVDLALAVGNGSFGLPPRATVPARVPSFAFITVALALLLFITKTRLVTGS